MDDPVHGVKTSRATVLEMKIPKNNVGVVIGRAGSNIKEIEQKSDTKINFKDEQGEFKWILLLLNYSQDGLTGMNSVKWAVNIGFIIIVIIKMLILIIITISKMLAKMWLSK